MTLSTHRIHHHANRCAHTAFAVGIATALVAGTPVQAQAEATIAVHANHFASAGRGYGDLDQLEAAVRAVAPSSLRIVWCDDASARGWSAVVARFGELPLRFDTVQAPAACGAAPLPVSARPGPLPSGIDDAAVAQYWNRRMP